MDALTRSAIERAYRLYAPIYDWVFGFALQQGRRRMTQVSKRSSAKRILEIGVGTGLTLSDYAPETAVYGVDISMEMIRRARRHDAHVHKSLLLVRADAELMPFADNSFDCVTLPYVLSVTSSPRDLIIQARRVCKPGGLILLLNHFSGGVWRPMERLLGLVSAQIGFRPNLDFDEHILAHDWKLESIESVNIFGLSKLVSLRNEK